MPPAHLRLCNSSFILSNIGGNVNKICRIYITNQCRTRRDSRGRYSRDDGRSEMMEHIEMAIDSADERDREKIKRFMRELENA